MAHGSKGNRQNLTTERLKVPIWVRKETTRTMFGNTTLMSFGGWTRRGFDDFHVTDCKLRGRFDLLVALL